MRFSSIVCLILLIIAANKAYGQKPVMDINIQDGTLIDLIPMIEEKSKYVFLYKRADLESANKVTVNVSQATIHEILEIALNKEKLEWDVYDRQIIIRKKAKIDDRLKAENISIAGMVTNQNGMPLPGAVVIVKNEPKGTITNSNGSYSLKVKNFSDTLIFSFVGLKTKEIPINGQRFIAVEMESESIDIEEVVAIGYGNRIRREITGSISSIKSEDILRQNASSFDATLQGLASGVNVISTSGVPGAKTSIKIRGINSINADTDPLWIIDGLPLYAGNGLENSISTVSQNPMSMINPADIESIEILKDAAATAIYGSRGSSGVILITTKTGASEKSRLNIDYSTGISDVIRHPDDIGFVNSKQWFKLLDLARANNDLSSTNPQDIIENSFSQPIAPITREEAENTETDWFDLIMRKGTYQNVNISSSVGWERAQIYSSFNFRNEKGVLKSNEFTRYSGRINANLTPSVNFDIGLKTTFSFTNNDRVKNEGGGGFGNTSGGRKSGFAQANLHGLPWFPVFDENHVTGYWNPASGANLVASIDPELIMDNVKQYRLIAGVDLKWRVPWIEGLTLQSVSAADFIQNNSIFWVTEHLTEIGSKAIDKAVTNSIYNINFFGTYSESIENHSLNLVLGSELMSENRFAREMEGRNLVGNYRELGNPSTLLNMSSKLTHEEYLLAFFSRTNYNFNKKYLINFSLRRDGSSKFLPSYRWGNFWALSAGWMLMEEEFLNLPESINFLKLRSSFGKTGNKDIPDKLTQTTFETNFYYRYPDPTLIGGGTRVSNIGIPHLTWETTDNYDIGIDFGLWNDRIKGSLGYYRQDVFDLLLKAPIPSSVGVPGSSVWNNIGDLRNQGLELSASTIILSDEDVYWRTTLNFTTNKNRVLRLTSDVDRAGAGILGKGKITKTGGSLNTYYMAEYAGVDPAKGVDMIYEIDIDHFNETGETIKTGRKIPATENNTNLHRIIHKGKTNIPTFFGGLHNSFSYKNFNLSVLFTFSGGNYLYDNLEIKTTIPHANFILRNDLIDNYWTEPGDNVKYMELTYQGINDWEWDTDANGGNGDWIEQKGIGKYGYNRILDRYLYKADFLKLRNVRLDYKVPVKLVKKSGLKGVILYLSAQNLFTVTEYEGYDPENTTWVDNQVPLPSLKVFNVGINVEL